MSNDFKKGPIGDGNQYVLQTYLNYLDELYQNNSNGGLEISFLILISQLNYFSNLFKFVTEDTRLKKIESIFFTNLWWYGKIGIARIDNQYEVVNIQDKIKKSQYLQKANYIFDSLNTNNINPDVENNNKKIKLVPEELVIFRWGQSGLPGQIWWYQFTKEQQFMWKAVFGEAMWINKKIQMDYGIELTTANKQMLKSLMNPGNSILMHNASEQLADIKPLDLPPLTCVGYDMIDRHRQMYYQMFGRRINENVKKEKNITDDLAFSMSSYNIMENNWLRELKISSLKLNEKFNLDLDIEFTDELESNTQPNQFTGENNE